MSATFRAGSCRAETQEFVLYSTFNHCLHLRSAGNSNVFQGVALSSESAIERESLSFSTNIDVDYDIAKAGISRKRFKDEYIKWIKYVYIQD